MPLGLGRQAIRVSSDDERGSIASPYLFDSEEPLTESGWQFSPEAGPRLRAPKVILREDA